MDLGGDGGEKVLICDLDLYPAMIGRPYQGLLRSLNLANAVGVNVFAGTDALNPNTFNGHSLLLELQHQANAGISAIDILRTATKEAATIIGAGDSLGTLEAGKLADVVL